jgi:hypothetical protein
MKLSKGDLVQELRSRPKNEFPHGGKVSYYKQFSLLAQFLNSDVHPHVTMGALTHDREYLNDHGTEHIGAVIERASELVSFPDCELTSYEIYLLLVAIHIHDIGNLFGRIGHESQPIQLSGEVDAKMGSDSAEKRLIYTIAESHGGTVPGTGAKDKIGQMLQPEERILNTRVRPQLLAGILRFADELADDRRRCARFPLEQGQIPEGNRIYHKYSQSLQSVIIDTQGKQIHLDFELSGNDMVDFYFKNKNPVLLLDEIFRRTVKMHQERIYCTRFLRPSIDISSINVKIRMYRSSHDTRELPSIGYRLAERGYPDETGSIYELCPELTNWDNRGPVSGQSLRDLVQGGGTTK